MVKVRIDIQDEEVRRALAKLEDNVQDMTPAFEEIGSALTASTLFRFERGVDPEGKAWPLSIRVQTSQGADKTLLDSGRLASSITWRAGPDFAEIGTNVIYAAVHQFGATIRAKAGGFLKFSIPGVGFRQKKSVTIPARPFLGVSDDDRREVRQILRDHVGAF